MNSTTIIQKSTMQKPLADPIFGAHTIVLIIFVSYIWLSHAQNVNQQHKPDLSNNDGIGSANNGEISRLPVLNENEPSCEELKAMWRFSRRQSRTSEMSNELPTYRDPFKHNIWDPYNPSLRNMNRGRAQPRYFGERAQLPPTFGTINYKVPLNKNLLGRTRSFNYNDFSRIYHNGREPWNWAAAAFGNRNNNNSDSSLRRRTQFRSGGNVQTHSSSPQNSILTPQKGSFQRLKELIWNERAQELAQQRKNEEMNARAAVLKEITMGQRYKRNIRPF